MINIFDIFSQRDIKRMQDMIEDAIKNQWRYYQAYYNKKIKENKIKSKTCWVRLYYKVIPEKIKYYVNISFSNIFNKKILSRERLNCYMVIIK